MLRASDVLSSCKRASKAGCSFADIKRGANALASGGIRISGCNLSQSVKVSHGEPSLSNTGSLQDCLLPVTDKEGRNFS